MNIKSWRIRKVKLVDVKMNPNNPRSIGREALEGLRESIDRFGYVEPIVWNKTTRHIIGGHQRYVILVENGVEEAIMVVAEMSPEDELAATISLNNPEIEGHWTDSVVDLLHQLEMADGNLFSNLRMDTLMSSLEKTPSETGQSDNFDTECPCCGHKWKIEEKDVEASEGK